MNPIEAIAALLLVIGSALVLRALVAADSPSDAEAVIESLPERRAA